ncbi:poly(ADP-ribose) glycohydrolase-like [Neocloeon triangulifer]|uniref:poly(ADP-ribose) glycohydrolase-like n=1 Tax=Neocloeon triangulifer TaxID=2078957 RepID=UPI00286ED547|nr:poly(ADP-ribose) glycohydrolase-like isoform X2 [Neocloeon triangulifer]XP_059490324.1 poly(ADP-ribose) glycohydrolase-like [Neocloeon triangulifer]
MTSTQQQTNTPQSFETLLLCESNFNGIKKAEYSYAMIIPGNSGTDKVCVAVPPDTVYDYHGRDYLLMPYSTQNVYPDPLNPKATVSRWQQFLKAMNMTPYNADEEFDRTLLVRMIDLYNFTHNFDYKMFEYAIKILGTPAGSKVMKDSIFLFFSQSFVYLLRDFTKDMPDQITAPLRLLRNTQNNDLEDYEIETVVICRLQAIYIMGAALLSLFPKRSSSTLHSLLPYGDYPPINLGDFLRVKSTDSATSISMKLQKLLCFFNYFNASFNKDYAPKEEYKLSFSRQRIKEFPKWMDSLKPMCKVSFTDEKIEDAKGDFLRVDFANRQVGGGILTHGLVQEEILFCCYPEMLIGSLLNEAMCYNEAAFFRGVRRFNNYKGYSETFEYTGNCCTGEEAMDEENYIKSRFVAMDAYPFTNRDDQYKIQCIERELRKAFAGFRPIDDFIGDVCTGFWGCGVFGGDPQLKYLIQWLVCSEVQRNMTFSTYKAGKEAENLKKIHKKIEKKKVTVGQLYRFLMMGQVDLKQGVLKQVVKYFK